MASGINPRAVRIAALIQRVIASSLEGKMHDKRLDGVTITEVRVTNDLQIAKVYWTQIGKPGHEDGERKRAQQALRQATGRLRSLVGAKAGLRLTPNLRFIYDEVPSQATEIEDVLTIAQKRDQELEAARANAQYAGDPDPYRHDDDEADESDEDNESDEIGETGETGDRAASEASEPDGSEDTAEYEPEGEQTPLA
ncbi:ribosome-binding factor A [Bombiscardovia nodaiensis]|uniref:Ribosome-binding factor A n=1 Tax=Bombiscardovia nodaiensis TaxID=2932181 RepID=A0ABM8B6K7_9BIFI|nr:ribosome-binding factor A [Bombiscardovia nodaiensis]